MGLGIAIVGILIALFGFIDALATGGDGELQTLRYILAVLGLILFALGVAVEQLIALRKRGERRSPISQMDQSDP
jgi:hypothetical protein